MQFSLLIAHYNNYPYFLECFKSIEKQTYQNFEVVIVDDCSTDDSFEKLLEFTSNKPKVRLYQNQENKGVGFTKRKLVELSKGDICGFLDPDDALTEDAIECSINAHKTNDIVAAYSKIYICDENLNVTKVFTNTKNVKNYNSYFFNLNFEVAHFFTFKRLEYFKTEGIIETYKVAEDQDIYLKLYELGKFHFISKPLYYYRIHTKGLSHQKEKTDIKKKHWHIVLKNTLKRRKISTLYGKSIEEIENLQEFIYEKQNSFLSKLVKKFR